MRDHTGRLRIRRIGTRGREGLHVGCRAVVVGDRVVDHADAQGVHHRHPAAVIGRHVIHDHVVDHGNRVPAVDIARGTHNIEAIDFAQADAATAAGTRVVALDQVVGDGDVAGSGRQTTTVERHRAADEDAAAGRIGALAEGLVEDHRVAGDQAATCQAELADTAAVRHREVAADLVAGDGIVCRAVTQRDTAARAGFGAAVLRDPVVVQVGAETAVVFRTTVLAVGVATIVGIGVVEQFGVADTDTAAISAVVAEDAIVADLQRSHVAAGQNATAIVSTRDRQAVDARVPSACVVEMPIACAIGGLLADDEDARAFFGAKEQGFVVGHISAKHLAGKQVEGTQRAGVDRVLAGIRIDDRWVGRGCVDLAIDQGPPVLQRRRSELGGIDGRGQCAPALQPDLLVHDHDTRCRCPAGR